VVLVIPTETGLAVFRDMMEQRRDHLTGLLMRLDDDELQAFLTGLRAVRAAREELHQDPSPDSPIVEPAATEPVTPPAPEPGATE
jgi:hypothetical protein